MRRIRRIWLIGPISTTIVVLLVMSLVLEPFIKPDFAEGAYTASSTDADGNTHLANNTVNDTYLYDTATDSSAETQQQLGVDPNWKNGVVRKSYGMSFDGGDYVTAPNSTSLNSIGNKLTLEAWVQITVASGWKTIVAKYTNPNNTTNGLAYILRLNNDGKVEFYYNTSSFTNITSTNALPTNTWCHVAGVYDGATTKIYINGVLNGTPGANTGNILDTNLVPVTIGQSGYQGGSERWTGLIDEVRISNSARYTGTFAPQRRHQEDVNTVGLWHFDEGEGQYTYDSSQYGNNGTRGANTGSSTDDPTWVTGANAVMDGANSSNLSNSTNWSNVSGSQNISLDPSSSTTSDKSYEMKVTGSNGLSFASASSQYISLGTPASLNFERTTAQTYEFWMKTTAAVDSRIFGHLDYGDNYKGYLIQMTAAGNIRIQLVNSWPGNQLDVQTTATINNGVWRHVAIVYDGSSTAAGTNIYIDGQRSTLTTTANTLSATIQTSAAFTIGRYVDTYFNGQMDEFRVSNSVRYTSNFTPSRRFATDGNTVGLWHMDEGTGQTVADVSGNANNGTLGANDSAASDDPTWVEGIPASGLQSAASSQNLTANGQQLTANSSQNWALPGYQYRKHINVTAADALPTGYAVETTENRGTIMDNKQSRPDANDWRVMYQPPNQYESLSFDGSNDYVNVPDSDSLSSIENGGTYSYWLKPISDLRTASFKGFLDTASGQVGAIQSHINSSGKLTCALGGNAGYEWVVNGDWSNQWHLVTCTWPTKVNPTMSLYVDGQFRGSAATSNSVRVDKLEIGRLNDANYFDKFMDDVRIYNRALSAKEIGELYSQRNSMTAGQLDSSLKGWWRMDEGSGQIVRDYSGQDNNGTLGATTGSSTDDPTWSTDGMVTTAQEVPRFIPHGSALNFDGASTYSSTANNPFANAQLSGGVTLEAWFKTGGANSNTYIADDEGYLSLGINNANKICGQTSGSGFSRCSSVSAVDGNWHHAAIIWVPGNKSYLYVDGVEVSSGTETAPTPDSQTRSFSVGSHSAGGGNFNGIIDEVRVSNIVRYRNNFTASTSPFAKDQNTLGLWHMDEGSGNTLTDSTGSNNGDMTGHAATWVTNGGKVDTTTQTQFKLIAPIAGAASDKNYYLYYGNLGEQGTPQSYNSYGLLLDGTNDYLIKSSASGLPANNAAQTISMWLNFPATTDQSIVALINGSSAVQVGFQSGNLMAWKYGGLSLVTAASNPSTNTWHNIVYTYNGSNTHTIYIDGSSSNTGSTTPQSSTPNTIYLSTWNGSSQTYSGRLDDVRVYNRALSPTEVASLYSNTATVSNSGLVSQWKFDDGSTNTAVTASDSVGSNSTTLTNFNFDQNSNWVVNSNLLSVTNSPTVAMVSATPEQESPIFFSWRESGGSWSVSSQIPATSSQLGASGVYASWNPNGVYSRGDYYRINSWAVEAFSTSDPARGKLRSFPTKANLIANNGGVDIIDAQTNKLWMRLATGANNIIGSNTPKSLTALNSRIVVGSADGLTVIDFTQDSAIKFTTSGNSWYGGTIADRADALAYAAAGGKSIVDNTVNDVSGATLTSTTPAAVTSGPRQSIAIATDNGMSVVNNLAQYDPNINNPNGTAIYDYAQTANDNYNDIAITTGGEIYGSNSTDSTLNVYTNVHSDSGDQIGTADVTYSTSSTPALKSGVINDISVTQGTSTVDPTGDTVALATDAGVDTLNTAATQANGSVRHYTKEVAANEYKSKIFGGAMEFDASTNDQINISAASNLRPTTAATFSLWVKPTSSWPNYATLLDCSVASGTVNYRLQRYNNTNELEFYDNTNVLHGGTMTVDSWNYILITVLNGAVTGYINGTQAFTGSGNNPLNTESANTRIGNNSGLNQGVAGVINDVRIYNRVLSADEIKQVQRGEAVATGKVGHWTFDEKDGQVVYDSSGNANNGTLGADANAATDDPMRVSPSIAGTTDKATAVGLQTPKSVGNDLQFDGSNDYVKVPDFSAMSAWTISTWVYETDTTSYAAPIVVKIGTAIGNGIVRNSGFWHGLRNDTVTGGTGVAVSLSTWTLLTFTWNGATSAFYANAQTGSSGSGGSSWGISDSRIGFGWTTHKFGGKLDDTRVYNRALSADEVKQLYTRSANPTNGLVGWWKMDEGTGQAVADSSGSGNNGTLGADGSVASDDPTWATGSPLDKESNYIWVGTNGAGADDGTLTAISLETDKQIKSFTSATGGLPDVDITSLSLGSSTTSGGLALVGTEAGAWNPGTAGFTVDDTAATPATIVNNSVRAKANFRAKGNLRVK